MLSPREKSLIYSHVPELNLHGWFLNKYSEGIAVEQININLYSRDWGIDEHVEQFLNNETVAAQIERSLASADEWASYFTELFLEEAETALSNAHYDLADMLEDGYGVA